MPTLALILLTTGNVAAWAWWLNTNVCTLSSYLLKRLPNPDEYTGIFMVKLPPRHYLIFYNALRFVSGGQVYGSRKPKNGTGTGDPPPGPESKKEN